jgi:hypothetical protein
MGVPTKSGFSESSVVQLLHIPSRVPYSFAHFAHEWASGAARPLPPIPASPPTPQTLAVRAGPQDKINLPRPPSKTAQNPHVNPPPTPKPHKTRTTTADFSSPYLA